jgi:protein-S-isoprenylcysteine O-methyltransferase Ste14
MEFFPELELGWLNGWLPLAVFYLVFGLMIAIFPRPVVERLYDLPKFEGRKKLVAKGGRVVAVLLTFGLLIFSPLKVGEPVFVIGGIVYLLGFAGMVWALITYRQTPLDQPVVAGLYRISRHPQVVGLMVMFLGCCLAVGSWLLVLAWVVMVFINHLRTVAEEQLCLAQYGDSYQAYMDKVARYFLFF